MADNTNYIGVAMGLDVTDLKAGLSEANKQIQLANSEFKAASSGMDDWSKSTEGITAKVKQLDSVLKAQKSKLAGLEAEYRKVAQEQGEGSEAAKRLKVQINNQKAVVNKTEKEFNNYSETLKEAKAGTLDLEKATLKNGKALKQAGDGAKTAGGGLSGFAGAAGIAVGAIAAVAAAAVGAVTGFLSLAESTREAREDMVRLNSAFAGAKMSTDSAKSTFTDLYKVIGETDTAVEAAQQIALLANSEEEAAKWASQAANVTATFGDALKPETFFEAANETLKLGEATGAFTQMLEGTGVNVEDFNAELASMNTEQEKQAYMLQVSEKAMGAAGKAYEEAASDIMDAREAEAELSLAMQELGAIAEPIMTTLKMLAVDVLNSIKPFVELVGTGLKGAFEGTAGATDMLAEGISGIAKTLLDKVAELVPKVLDVIVQVIPSIVSSLLEAIPQMYEAGYQIMGQLITALADLLPQIALKIVEVIPSIITAILSAIPQFLEAAFLLFEAIIQTIPQLITKILAVLPTVITAIINAIITAIPIVLEAAIKLLMAIVDAIPVIIQSLVTSLPKIIESIINGLLKALPLILEAAVKLLMAIVQAIPKIIPSLVSALPKIVSSIVSVLGKNIPNIIKAALELLLGIVKAIPQIQIELVKSIPEIITTIVSSLGEGFSDMKDAGLDLLKGLWEGIKGGASWIKDKITGFAGDVAGWFKDTFKISSPSKLIEDEVGVYVGQAVVPTRPAALSKVKKQLGKFTNYVSDNLSDIKGNLALEGAGGVSGVNRYGSRNTVINAGMTVNYNGKLSRKELKRIENDNYIAVRTKLKAEGAI